MSSIADHSLAFWTAPIGGAVVTFLLGYPAECGTAQETIDHTLGNEPCNNLLGFNAFMPSEAGAAVLALVVGGVFYGIASLFEGNKTT